MIDYSASIALCHGGEVLLVHPEDVLAMLHDWRAGK